MMVEQSPWVLPKNFRHLPSYKLSRSFMCIPTRKLEKEDCTDFRGPVLDAHKEKIFITEQAVADDT